MDLILRTPFRQARHGKYLIEPHVHNMDLKFCLSCSNRTFIIVVMVPNLIFISDGRCYTRSMLACKAKY
jgi:hypothetical protein